MSRVANSLSKLTRSFVFGIALSMICTGVACDKDKNGKSNKSGAKTKKISNSESGSVLRNGSVKLP